MAADDRDTGTGKPTGGERTPANVIILDPVGLRLGKDGRPDPGDVAQHVRSKGAAFYEGSMRLHPDASAEAINFFYLPELSEPEEILSETGNGSYDAVIAAATVIPPEAKFRLGGVRIGTGTGNMRSLSWGGPDGSGGEAPLMNTPGINSRATAQMVMKALLKVAPDLPVDELHELVAGGRFDTGKDLYKYPTEKLEGKRIAILGHGNIGREVARLAEAFRMSVVFYARPRHRDQILAAGHEYAETPAAAANGADVLSVHLGLGRQDPATGRFANAGLIDWSVLQGLNDGSVLINYDRGELVDIASLDRALSSGKVRHAAIDADIFRGPDGPTGPMAPYLSLLPGHKGKLELLPHAAADTDHPTRVAGAKRAVDQLLDSIRSGVVTNLVGALPPGYSS